MIFGFALFAISKSQSVHDVANVTLIVYNDTIVKQSKILKNMLFPFSADFECLLIVFVLKI